MMNAADEKTIRQGIEIAERHIAEIEARLAEVMALNGRKATLAAYIQHARALLGEQPTGSTVAVADRIGPTEERALWEHAADVLRTRNHPMHIKDIERAIVRAGHEFKTQHATEVLRGAMNRRTEVFEPVARGWYALKAWPAEMKKRTPILSRPNE